ncbi:hypothetical protein PCC9214_05444 (plasmid) [Planktothrix tepida]|uniref:Uncharacterized protein n=1 Tax=Planktothrix tepida PCC 9214 TaxID=671072 RepID=A0A1J1LPL1_9CYAN|nr:hypothetical protein [Planktothrix tepida]CAD5988706.1 hypothetical protein PCC9214_05444 [Planktothrix tepida]CUR33954.1 hypothetical protein PL921460063 [Planktothrix tepida PCC 9214]
MNSIRDKVIECLSSKGWDREDEEWKTDKIIPYVRFSNPIMPQNNKDFRYCVAVTVWGKSVTTDIQEYSSTCDDLNTMRRIAQVTFADFLERSDELIESAHQYLYKHFIP